MSINWNLFGLIVVNHNLQMFEIWLLCVSSPLPVQLPLGASFRLVPHMVIPTEEKHLIYGSWTTMVPESSINKAFFLGVGGIGGVGPLRFPWNLNQFLSKSRPATPWVSLRCSRLGAPGEEDSVKKVPFENAHQNGRNKKWENIDESRWLSKTSWAKFPYEVCRQWAFLEYLHDKTTNVLFTALLRKLGGNYLPSDLAKGGSNM